MSCPTIFVLRHGETVWNAEGRWQGGMNSPLTDTGRRQAARQGRILAALDLDGVDVLVSPQGRAFQTAAIALAERVTHLRTDDRLREIEVGDWTGKLRSDLSFSPKEVSPETPDGHLALYEHAPGGEGYTALMERCADFLKDLKRPSILVTHGITSRMLRCLAMGLAPSGLGDLPGGQGVVHVVENTVHKTLEEGVAHPAVFGLNTRQSGR